MKKNLGLPLGYSKLAKFYDAFNEGNSEEMSRITNRVIGKILAERGVKRVLDMTCGTGAQVLWLAKQGYEVTGSDFSPPLLEMARKKAAAERLNITFIEGDMRTLQVGQFDAVITIFNAVGHLTKGDFEKAMRNIHANLKPGGLYLFDIFNLEAEDLDHLEMDISGTLDGITVRDVQYSTLDRENGLLTSYDTFFVDGKELKGEFTMQIYTAGELKEMLNRSGFEVLARCDIDGSDFVEETTQNMLTVARKQLDPSLS